jgi:hypothetical protein
MKSTSTLATRIRSLNKGECAKIKATYNRSKAHARTQQKSWVSGTLLPPVENLGLTLRGRRVGLFRGRSGHEFSPPAADLGFLFGPT